MSTADSADRSERGSAWGLAILVLALVTTVAAGLLTSAQGRNPMPPPGQERGPTLQSTPSHGSVVRPAPPTPDRTARAVVSSGWVADMARRTGIPERALQGYATADLLITAERPGCRLGWPTLAGIGFAESAHGHFAGRTLTPDGRPTTPIVGIPLDGSVGIKAIPDTDDGRLDGDLKWDHAVGPMQFIPSTWTTWGFDADGDGTADPQQIDDAAFTAARLLCATGEDLSQASGWHHAILRYNASTTYADLVLTKANTYADASHP